MIYPRHRLQHAEPGAGASQGMPPLPGVEATSTPAPPVTPAAVPDPPAAASAPAPAPTPTPGMASPDATGLPTSSAPDDTPWQQGLPEDLRASESLRKFSSADDLARSYLNLESATGTSIRIPGEDASVEDRKGFTDKLVSDVPELMYRPDLEDPEAKQQFLRTLGVPESSEKYVTPVLEGLDDKYQIKDDKMFRTLAHEVGLTNAQFQHLSARVAEEQLKTSQSDTQAFSEDNQGLREKWGEAYGDRYRAAHDILKKTGAPPNVIALFDQGRAHSSIIEYGYSLYTQFGGEGSELISQAGGADINNAPAEAQAKIDEIMGNKQHAYWQSGSPDHEKALQNMLRLRTLANPKLTKPVATGGLPPFAAT